MDGKTPVSLEGVDVLRAGEAGQGVSNGAAEEFADFLSGRSAYLSTSALSAAGRKVGDSITLSANGHAIRVRVAGILPSSSNTNAATMDIAAAQWRFGMLGRLQRLDIQLAPGIGIGGASGDPRGVCRLTPSWRIPPVKRRATTGFPPPIRVNLDMCGAYRAADRWLPRLFR